MEHKDMTSASKIIGYKVALTHYYYEQGHDNPVIIYYQSVLSRFF